MMILQYDNLLERAGQSRSQTSTSTLHLPTAATVLKLVVRKRVEGRFLFRDGPSSLHSCSNYEYSYSYPTTCICSMCITALITIDD